MRRHRVPGSELLELLKVGKYGVVDPLRVLLKGVTSALRDPVDRASRPGQQTSAVEVRQRPTLQRRVDALERAAREGQ
jgi:hypothetical protein